MRNFLFIFLFTFSLPVFGWGWGYENDPISLGMGKARTCISSDYVSHHIDHIAFAKKASLHSFYQNNYWIPEIGYVGLGFTWPHPYVNTSISASFQGFEAYGEYSIGIGFAHFFKPYISLALQGNYLGFFQATDDASYHSGSLNLALRIFPIHELCIGFSATNLSFSYFKTEQGKIKIPTIFQLGLAYNFSNKVLLTVEMTKDLEEKARFSLGVNYKCIPLLTIRAGAYFASGIAPSVGFGFHFKHIQIDAGFLYHFTTGFSSSVGIVITWPTTRS